MPNKIRFSSFLLPKSDSTMDECQDALGTPRGCSTSINEDCLLDKNVDSLRFSVADGLTTAFYSGFWAQKLVSLFQEGLLKDWERDGQAWKYAADLQWQNYMSQQTLGSISQNRHNQRDPAASTFCGIEIRRSDDGTDGFTWRVIAVGDSCVIHLTSKIAEADKQELAFESYPCKNAAAFSCVTTAIASYDTSPLPPAFVGYTPGLQLLKDGDILLLATDALCEWMIKLHETDHPVWKTIVELDDNERFRQIVEDARRESASERLLKDDDVALIVIRIGDHASDFIANDWVYTPGELLELNTALDGPSNFSMFLSDSVQTAQTQENRNSKIRDNATSGPKKESLPRKIWGVVAKPFQEAANFLRPHATKIEEPKIEEPLPFVSDSPANVPTEQMHSVQPSQTDPPNQPGNPEFERQESEDANQ